ncbi:class I SAM-dependent methyltransferase [Actinoplanes sp. NPDC051470]|uniref:class I SAM-dependent methyltransferase n=1 Tax=Actinoplanes sp. NPDC051470 TaxID=3157224 RepID=UPI00344539AE
MSDRRWDTVLTYLAAAAGPTGVIAVDGPAEAAALLAARLRARSIEVSPSGDVVVRARTSRSDGRRDDVAAVVDLSDPSWPILSHADPARLPAERWYSTESRAFFAVRAARWDAKFGDDLPAYTAAVSSSSVRPGGVAIDIGCGTGRALPPLRDAVGPAGTVIGVDHTPEMLQVAAGRARASAATLVQGDARQLPFATGTADALFAAGLVTHLPEQDEALSELARITRPGGRLILFHPTGRATLAARHGRTLDPSELLAADVLPAVMSRTGWSLLSYDDAPDRFHAVGQRN